MSYISKTSEELENQLKALAKGIISDLTEADPARSKELLGVFVSELFLSLAEQSRQEERRRKQAEGIAAAKARGVRFGRTAAALPENFDEVRRSWRSGAYTVERAAELCGLPRGTFYNAVIRAEQAEKNAG